MWHLARPKWLYRLNLSNRLLALSVLNEEQLKTLLSVAQSLGINPDQLKADNP